MPILGSRGWIYPSLLVFYSYSNLIRRKNLLDFTLDLSKFTTIPIFFLYLVFLRLRPKTSFPACMGTFLRFQPEFYYILLINTTVNTSVYYSNRSILQLTIGVYYS